MVSAKLAEEACTYSASVPAHSEIQRTDRHTESEAFQHGKKADSSFLYPVLFGVVQLDSRFQTRPSRLVLPSLRLLMKGRPAPIRASSEIGVNTQFRRRQITLGLPHTLKSSFMAANSLRLNLKYKLPDPIKGVLKGWIGSCQNAAVVSVLVASIVAQLMSPMGIIQDPDTDNGTINPAALKALTVFAYSVLLLTCGATLSALLLIDEFGELPYRAAKQSSPPTADDPSIGTSLSTHLQDSGLHPDWRWIRAHFKIILLLVTVFSIAPLVLLVLPPPRHFITTLVSRVLLRLARPSDDDQTRPVP
ncbi:hypothetical protein EVG20_g2410 [Dentipellis fragilis]|uniref:Uncharacterized protein n=1 Tax=Dentipellis fragilis TaxID=205917 RepID=A0A4Y9Z773_9AGAM|nr:hypothetical protein EVG20_g2410 [Dentipellis fragilis]